MSNTGEEREHDRQVRAQAVALTEATFLRIRPRPMRTVNQVAPVVYALLIDDIDPRLIEQALIAASVHTANGIGYALRQIIPPHDKTLPPKYRDIPPPSDWHPSEEEKAAAKKTIAEIRARLRATK